MKYIDEFRDHDTAQKILASIHKAIDPKRDYRLMEFCGGHTHAIYRHGLPGLLPENIRLLHGPGCPVCVLPIARIDCAIALAKQPNTILCSYGDMLRVPGSRRQSLLSAKADGADVRMVYSVDDALQLARENLGKDVIFFAIGFETTTPPTAAAILQAEAEGLKNFRVFCNHLLTPVAMSALLHAGKDDALARIDGFIGPAHVSVVIGSRAYEAVAMDYQKPIVIAGFEPLDILQSILMLVQLVNRGEAGVKNEYTRAVTPEGNLKSQQLMREVFEVRDQFEWRGLGWIPKSGLRIREKYRTFDAEHYYELPTSEARANKACACGEILRGIKTPEDCPLFGRACTPETPIGSCMVSSEGACAAHFHYGCPTK